MKFALGRALAVTGSALAMVVAFAGSSIAEPAESPATRDSISAASLLASFSFQPDGDRVAVCDDAADGYGVRLRVKNVTHDPDTEEYTVTNTNGADGPCEVRNAAMGQPWNLAETHCFRFTIWLVNNGEQVGDKAWVQLRNYNDDGPVNCDGVN